MNATTLSIITVNLNNAEGLEYSLKSVIEQSYRDFEIILVDGGSTDGSLEIINKYSQRIKYWVSEPDSGIYNAMNKAITQSSGKYCYFLNSGEVLYDRNVFENFFKLKPVEPILLGNVIMVYKNVVRLEKYPRLPFSLFYTGSVCHQAAFISKELFNSYGLYDEKLKIVSDWKFFLKTIVLNNVPVSYYDINVAYHDLYGISITNEKLFLEEREQVLREFIPHIILNEYNEFLPDLLRTNRLKKFQLIYSLILLWDRLINKLERIRMKYKLQNNESIFKMRMTQLKNQGIEKISVDAKL